ncbi:prenyltransferase [Aquiluna sp. KACHI24]|uniref:prenyltransferase n=1 Tax=Aquiluna sp. KACHI24 TaxID=2968831 RepID=UPI002203E57E|nr:prenyltransferase [Aquiluna sp. KACHI24]BDP99976.1 prenyltransferase [Aquiluna sp. KACHI24]
MLKKLFISSRPISWINTAFPFAAAYFLATGELDTNLLIGSLFFLIPYNLLMYGVNDVFDYPSDLRNPRKGGIEGGLLEPKYHRPTLLISFGLTIPFVIYLLLVGDLLSSVVLMVVLFSVVAYSLGGLRFKEIPFLDSFTSAMHFVGPMLFGLTLAGASFDQRIWLITFSFTLWGMASHAFGAVQDIRADREAGIASIATVLGAKATVRIAFFMYLVAGVVTLFLGDRYPQAALAALPYLFVVGREWGITDENCEVANRGWRRFIYLNFLAGAIVSAVIIGPQPS